MNNKVFSCLPIAWDLWQRNPIHKAAWEDNFDKFWNNCRKEIIWGLKNGETFDPKYINNNTDVRWFVPRKPRRNMRFQKPFDELVMLWFVQYMKAKELTRYFKIKQSIKG